MIGKVKRPELNNGSVKVRTLITWYGREGIYPELHVVHDIHGRGGQLYV